MVKLSRLKKNLTKSVKKSQIKHRTTCRVNHNLGWTKTFNFKALTSQLQSLSQLSNNLLLGHLLAEFEQIKSSIETYNESLVSNEELVS